MSVRFKYYLRGCGAGILVASFIFIITLHVKGGVMTDEKAMARASELGMVMSEESQTSESQSSATQATQIPVTETNTPDTQRATQKESQTQDAKKTETETETQQKDSKKTQESKDAKDTKNTKNTETKDTQSTQKQESTEKKDTKKDTAKDTKKKDEEKSSEESENVSITIKSGEVCRQIAQKLKDEGLVQDAEDFRKYMQEHNYAKYIRVGTFTLKKGMSYAEIAQVLTKR